MILFARDQITLEGEEDKVKLAMYKDQASNKPIII